MVLGHLGWDLLGNLENGKYVPVLISQFPNFPNSAEPDGLRSFGKLGNWEIGKYVPVPISQFPKWCWAIWAGMIWEIGKYVLTSQFPNLPNSTGSDGLGSFGKFGKLGNMYL